MDFEIWTHTIDADWPAADTESVGVQYYEGLLTGAIFAHCQANAFAYRGGDWRDFASRAECLAEHTDLYRPIPRPEALRRTNSVPAPGDEQEQDWPRWYAPTKKMTTHLWRMDSEEDGEFFHKVCGSERSIFDASYLAERHLRITAAEAESIMAGWRAVDAENATTATDAKHATVDPVAAVERAMHEATCVTDAILSEERMLEAASRVEDALQSALPALRKMQSRIADLEAFNEGHGKLLDRYNADMGKAVKRAKAALPDHPWRPHPIASAMVDALVDALESTRQQRERDANAAAKLCDSLEAERDKLSPRRDKWRARAEAVEARKPATTCVDSTRVGMIAAVRFARGAMGVDSSFQAAKAQVDAFIDTLTAHLQKPSEGVSPPNTTDGGQTNGHKPEAKDERRSTSQHEASQSAESMPRVQAEGGDENAHSERADGGQGVPLVRPRESDVAQPQQQASEATQGDGEKKTRIAQSVEDFFVHWKDEIEAGRIPKSVQVCGENYVHQPATPPQQQAGGEDLLREAHDAIDAFIAVSERNKAEAEALHAIREKLAERLTPPAPEQEQAKVRWYAAQHPGVYVRKPDGMTVLVYPHGAVDDGSPWNEHDDEAVRQGDQPEIDSFDAALAHIGENQAARKQLAIHSVIDGKLPDGVHVQFHGWVWRTSGGRNQYPTRGEWADCASSYTNEDLIRDIRTRDDHLVLTSHEAAAITQGGGE